MEAKAHQGIEALEKKLAKGEAANLVEFQRQVLKELYQIRRSLHEAFKKAPAAPEEVTEGSATDDRIKKLQEENRKQAYRIEHLVRNLKERM